MTDVESLKAVLVLLTALYMTRAEDLDQPWPNF